MAEKLLEAGVGTIERLGTMTPEELEEIPGIDPASVEFIQAAVVAYYSQFEDPGVEGGAEGSMRVCSRCCSGRGECKAPTPA